MNKSSRSVLFLLFIFLMMLPLTVLGKNTLPKQPGMYEIWLELNTGMEFVWMPEVCFQMGSRDSNKTAFLYTHEKPMHEVCLDGFWMGKYEVTNSQYRHYLPSHDSGELDGKSLNGEQQPAVFVSWDKARAFAQWLTEKYEGKYQFRLPTEAEWEHGCRAGTEKSRFWGQESRDACQYANVADEAYKAILLRFHDCVDTDFVSAPVGKYKPNDAGLHDMLGNVWEWCEDLYGKESYKYLEKNQTKNPVYQISETKTNFRVVRGGSWMSNADSIRCAKRSPVPPESRFNVIGFRLVLVTQ